jgi:hypothetical protein
MEFLDNSLRMFNWLCRNGEQSIQQLVQQTSLSKIVRIALSRRWRVKISTQSHVFKKRKKAAADQSA